MFVPVRATPGGQSVFSADGVITDTSWCPLLAACCLLLAGQPSPGAVPTACRQSRVEETAENAVECRLKHSLSLVVVSKDGAVGRSMLVRCKQQA